MSLEFALFAPRNTPPVVVPDTRLLYTEQHSWFGKYSHVVRSDGCVHRCTIGRLSVSEDGQVGVELLFRENSKQLRKLVSPMFVAAVRMLWINRDIVSEDDAHDQTVDEQQQPSDRSLPELRLLPTIGCILTTKQRRPLEYIFRQTQMLLHPI